MNVKKTKSFKENRPEKYHVHDSFKALIPVDQWVVSLPAVSKFVLGHDTRTKVQGGTTNRTAVSIYFEFSDLMGYNSVTQPI